MHPIIKQVLVHSTDFAQSWSAFHRTDSMHWLIVSWSQTYDIDQWGFHFATNRACHAIETLLISSAVDCVRYSSDQSQNILWCKHNEVN